MRRATLVATVLLLSACNSRSNWANQQAELANDLNSSSSAAQVNATAPAANEAAPANDVNATAGNEGGNELDMTAPANEAAPKG
jgi:uncharacterized lipoprotein